jgi:hypothetical protein
MSADVELGSWYWNSIGTQLELELNWNSIGTQLDVELGSWNSVFVEP